MASKLPVWGIDVGQSSLKAVKLQESDGQVEMVAFDIVEHETILSEAEADSTEMAKQAIETFLSRNDLTGATVVVSVPGQQTLTRFTKMPPVERKKIPDMVQYEASQQIPFDMDEVVWDYQVFTEDDSPDVEVGIFAIRKELIRNYLMQFTELGIEPQIVQASPMASYNAARYEFPPEEENATILLDMGALATDLIVMEKTRIWSRPVPVGGNRFTDALVSAFKLSFRKAEHLKRNAASSKHARQVFQAMRPVFADLVSEIQRSIGFYTSTHREANITSVIGMGNAFKLPGLQKFLQQNLHMDAHKFSGFKNTKIVATERLDDLKENVMSFAVAHGLALQGLGHGTVGANLLPLEVRRTLLWRKKKPWFAASAASLALAAGAMWVGNVMAGGQIQESIGSMSSFQPKSPPNLNTAEQWVSSSGSGSAVERAAKVAGAAKKFTQELASVNSKKSGDENTLKTMAELPENNVYIPRILGVIHEAFGEATSPALEAASGPRAYRQVALKTPRQDRKEAWIETLTLFYDSKAPESKWDANAARGKTKPGWAVEITGRTPIPQGTAEQWLQESLISVMDRLGKKPEQGFYFDEVRLYSAQQWTPPTTIGTQIQLPTGGGDGAAAGGARGRGGGRGRGRGTTRGGTRGGGTRGGRGVTPPGRGGRGAPSLGGPATGGSTQEVGERLREEFKKKDPLLGEAFENDCRFVIRAIIRKGDTPDKLIPEVYQEKKEDEKKK